jgi:hypothetical protein
MDDGILPNIAQALCGEIDMKRHPPALQGTAGWTHLMARNDRSFEESRLPQGTLLVAALFFLLAAGVYLIVSSLL